MPDISVSVNVATSISGCETCIAHDIGEASIDKGRRHDMYLDPRTIGVTRPAQDLSYRIVLSSFPCTSSLVEYNNHGLMRVITYPYGLAWRFVGVRVLFWTSCGLISVDVDVSFSANLRMHNKNKACYRDASIVLNLTYK